jgi:hypothetical protein
VLNQQLSAHLPESFASLSLCAIDNTTATFVTDNQALAFRAQKQPNILLDALSQLPSCEQITKVAVQVNLRPLHKYE